MKLIMAVLFVFFLSSCAHHHNKVEHTHVYKKHCAYDVSQGKFGVKGSDEFKLEHYGKTYYFSSKEKKEKFLKHIDKNIKAANLNWAQRDLR